MSWLKENWPIVGATLLTVVLLVICVWASYEDERDWERYAEAHHCSAKGIKKGQVVTGFGPTTGKDGGVAITTSVTPDQTIYVCDGGEMVIR